MEKSFIYEKKEYLHGMRGTLMRNKTIPLGTVVLFPLITIAEIAYFAVKGWDALSIVMGAILVISYMLLLFLFGVYPGMWYKQKESRCPVHRVKFNENSVEVHDEGGSAEYSSFLKVSGDRSFLYFLMKNRSCLMLPKRIFSDDELTELSERYNIGK